MCSDYSLAVVSDVSVGYGTPQIISLTKSLSEMYGWQSLILEPDQPERPVLDIDLGNKIGVKRLYTATHPYTPSGQIDYNLQVAEYLNKYKPDVIVLCAFLGAGALSKLKYKPKSIIYYGIEHTDGRVYEINTLKCISELFTFAIFPEENRALLDRPRIGMDNTPYAIVYNGSSLDVSPVSVGQKNKKIFYGGLLHPELTFADYFFDGPLDQYAIDLYGLVDGYKNASDKIEGLVNRGSHVKYNGYLPGGNTFLEILKSYLFSIVMWNPNKESTLYAAPNKFFDAIQAGVPVIAAPHPLCQKLVTRYGCGVLMGGFSLADLKLALRDAFMMVKTGQYQDVISSKMPLARAELSWEAQVKKIEPLVSSLVLNKD